MSERNNGYLAELVMFPITLTKQLITIREVKSRSIEQVTNDVRNINMSVKNDMRELSDDLGSLSTEDYNANWAHDALLEENSRKFHRD